MTHQNYSSVKTTFLISKCNTHFSLKLQMLQLLWEITFYSSFWKYQRLLIGPPDKLSMRILFIQSQNNWTQSFANLEAQVSIDWGSQSLLPQQTLLLEDTLHSLNKHFIKHCIWKQLWITAIFAEVELIAQQSKTPKCHFSFLKH